MTSNEFVSHVQLEIDKLTDKDPEVASIDVINPNSTPLGSIVVSFGLDGSLQISQ